MLWRCTFRLDQSPHPPPAIPPSLVFLSQHHWYRSHQAARFVFFVLFSFFFFWRTDSPAGCHHSAQRSWLIICQAPWGMRPVCQQQAQCFSEQRWRLERARVIQPLCGQEGRKTSEAARTKGGKGERERSGPLSKTESYTRLCFADGRLLWILSKLLKSRKSLASMCGSWQSCHYTSTNGSCDLVTTGQSHVPLVEWLACIT